LDHDAPADVSSNDGTALLMAAWSRHAEMVRLLLERGADPNAASPSGETPIMAAAFTARADIAALLLDGGADVNRRTTTGPSNFFSARGGPPPVC
jgi:ankyrin repeat protein